MASRSRGTGGYTPSEEHIVITASTYAGGGHPVVVCHGGGDGGDQYEPIANRADLNVLADTGLVVCAADLGGLHTWGNDAGTAAVDAMLAWLAATYDTDNTKVVLIGDSHGALTALNWAVRNPSATAAIVLRVPAVGLDAAHDRNVGGLAGTIEGCYNALVLSGSSGAYASTPDAASLDITGDIDVRVDVALADWTPAAEQSLASKFVATGNQRSWRLLLNATTGTLGLATSADGSAQLFHNSTVAVGAADGARVTVRATLDVVNGANRVATFYTGPTVDGPWTQLGSPVTVAGNTSLFAGTAPVEVGTFNAGTGAPATGTFYAAKILDGIGGTVAADPTFGRATATTTFNDTTGKTWTKNGTATYAGYEAALPTHDPSHPTLVAQQISLGLVPKTRCFYDTADPIVLPAEVEAYCDATGVQLTALSSTGNHEPWSKVHAEAQASWIWDRLT